MSSSLFSQVDCDTVNLDFASSAPACQGEVVKFKILGYNSNYVYSWSFGSGATVIAQNADTADVEYSSSGLKSVTLTLLGTGGGDANCPISTTKGITINPEPTAFFTPPADACVGEPVDFSNGGSSGSQWNYEWDFGSGANPNTSSAENPQGIVYSTSGVKTVTLIITDDNGNCSDSYSDNFTILTTPEADFASTAPACTDETVDFTNTGSTGANYSFEWDFGSGSSPATSTSENPSTAYASAGNKNVQLVITHTSGCTDTARKAITINQTPDVSFSASPSTQCQGSEVDFTYTGTSTESRWNFNYDFGNGANPQTSTSRNPSGIVYSTDGNKVVTLSINDQDCSASDTIQVQIDPTPVADFSSNAPQCTGDTVEFINTGTSGASYDWDFGSGASPATSTLENPMVTYGSSGNKIVMLVTTLGSCTDTMEKSIVVHETPSVSFTSTAPQCAGSDVDFTNTGSTGANWNYDWDFGADANPGTSTSENPQAVKYTSGGSKTVTFTIYDQYCSATSVGTINIETTPVADFSSNAPQCTGDTVEFINTGTSGATYDWDFSSGASPATSTLENPMVTYGSSGNKLVTLVTTLGNCTDTMEKSIVIHQTPSVSFTSTAPRCAWSNVDFTNTGGTGANWNYDWDFGAGADPETSTSEHPSAIKYATGGSKTVTFTIYDQYCSATSVGTINIETTPVADFSSNAPKCTGDTVEFTNTGTIGAAYEWNFGSGASPSTSNNENPEVIYSSQGNKLVQLITTLGNCRDTMEKAIILHLTPTISFTSTAPQCAKTGVDFTNTGTTGNLWSYEWDFGAGAVPENSNGEHPAGIEYKSGGEKTITFTINSDYCTNTDSATIDIYTLPFVDAGEDTTICANRCVQIGNDSVTGTNQGSVKTYSWFPSSTLDSASIPAPTACPEAEINNYVLTVTDTVTGCINTDTATVTMVTTAFADAGIDAEICFGEQVQIGSGLIEGQTYLWLPAEGLTDDAISNPVAAPDSTTEYTMFTTYKGCDTISDDVLVIVHPLPDIDAVDDESKDSTKITTGSQVQLIVTGGVQYEWTPFTGLNNPGMATPIASPGETTVYSVTGTDMFGCSNTDSIRVEVIEPDFWTPEAFTPNDDGKNDVFYVRTKGTVEFRLRVFDRWGNMIFQSSDPLQGWDGFRQGSGEKMPEGAYMYHAKGILSTDETFDDKGMINLIR